MVRPNLPQDVAGGEEILVVIFIYLMYPIRARGGGNFGLVRPHKRGVGWTRWASCRRRFW